MSSIMLTSRKFKGCAPDIYFLKAMDFRERNAGSSATQHPHQKCPEAVTMAESGSEVKLLTIPNCLVTQDYGWLSKYKAK